MTATLTEDVVQTTTTTTPEDAAHIVLIPLHLRGKTTPQAYVLAARIEGFEIQALCGYRWIPKQSAAGKPVCERCLEIYQDDPKGHGDRGDLPDE